MTEHRERAREVMTVWSSDPANAKANRAIAPFEVWKALADEITAALASVEAEEREACARIVESHSSGGSYRVRDDLAAAIRSRGTA